ncbi:MAG TPA: glycosyltransferase [Candidatus Paceibacterota bacterium]|nr:glycosyltransferase [Candidatus Paceibacterota bacterium]
MRIAVFSDNYYPELSGVSDSPMITCRELAKRGHQIKFIVPRYSEADYEKVGAKEKELDLDPNISVHRLPSIHASAASGQGRLALPLGFLSELKAWKPDIMHNHLIGGAGLASVLAKKRLKVPLVGTNHTVIREYIRFSLVRTHWFEEFSVKYVSWLYNHCDFVSAPSDYIFPEMIKYGFKKPHKAISNPVRTEIFKPGSAEERAEAKRRFKVGGRTLIFVSHLSLEKRFDVLLRVTAELNKTSTEPTNMLIVGSGPEEKNLKNLARELGIEGSVNFTGFLNVADQVAAYHASDIFVIASESETQSMTMMNAMACGLPVVAARAAALPEYVTPKVGFTVEPRDVGEFAQKIDQLFKNEELRKQLGQAARLEAERFSVENIATEWENIYREFSGGA